MKYPFTMLSHCLIFHADETSNESPTCPCPLLEMQLQNQTLESSRHRRTEPQRRIRIPRQDRPAHSSRLTSKRQDEHRQSEDSVPPISPTRGFPPVQDPYLTDAASSYPPPQMLRSWKDQVHWRGSLHLKSLPSQHFRPPSGPPPQQKSQS